MILNQNPNSSWGGNGAIFAIREGGFRHYKPSGFPGAGLMAFGNSAFRKQPVCAGSFGGDDYRRLFPFSELMRRFFAKGHATFLLPLCNKKHVIFLMFLAQKALCSLREINVRK